MTIAYKPCVITVTHPVQVLQYLSRQFQGRVISGLVRKHLRGNRRAVEWPARSPDFSPCDYWLFK